MECLTEVPDLRLDVKLSLFVKCRVQGIRDFSLIQARKNSMFPDNKNLIAKKTEGSHRDDLEFSIQVIVLPYNYERISQFVNVCFFLTN